MIYPNLNAEMARRNISQQELAELIGRTKSTMSLKLNGKTSLSLEEAFEIKNAVRTRLTLDVLFATDKLE